MELSGFVIIHIDVEPDVAYAYNRWYDLDHGPEAVRLPGVLGTRRYHASAALIAARVAQPPDGALWEFLTLYWLGGADLLATRQGMLDHLGPDSAVAKSGRLFRRDKVRLRSSTVNRRVGIHRRDGLDAAPEAVPYCGHLGVYVEVWDAAPKESAWLEAEHIPLLTTLPGILGAILVESAEPNGAARKVVVALLGEAPGEVAIPQRERLLAEKTPASLGRQFGGCFDLITPLRYDFAKA